MRYLIFITVLIIAPAQAESNGKWFEPEAGTTTKEHEEAVTEEFETGLDYLDELLLKTQDEEQEEQQQADAASGGGGGGNEGADEANEGGAGAGSSEDDLTDAEKISTRETSPGTKKDFPPPPKDVGDGKDDDIVARQLRELAQKEEDPEARQKLWDEYRDYTK